MIIRSRAGRRVADGQDNLDSREQGLGDEIVFCSCIPELLAQAGRVIIVCEVRLEKLFQRSFPQATVIGYPRRKDKKPCEVAVKSITNCQWAVCRYSSAAHGNHFHDKSVF